MWLHGVSSMASSPCHQPEFLPSVLYHRQVFQLPVQHPGDAKAPGLRLIREPQFTAFPTSPHSTLVRDKPFLPCIGPSSAVPQRASSSPVTPSKGKALRDALFQQKQSVPRYRRLSRGAGVIYSRAPPWHITRGQNVLETRMRPRQAPAAAGTSLPPCQLVSP